MQNKFPLKLSSHLSLNMQILDKGWCRTLRLETLKKATGQCKIMEFSKKQQNCCQCIDIQNYIPGIDFNKPKL